MQMVPVTITPASARIVEAETALIQALERLGSLQVAALTGGRYDPDEYDDAVIAYRHARAAAEDARTAWARLSSATWHVAV